MIRETTKRIDKATGNRGGWASASPVPVDVTLAAAAAAAPGSEARATRQTRSDRHKSMKVCSQGSAARQVKARWGARLVGLRVCRATDTMHLGLPVAAAAPAMHQHMLSGRCTLPCFTTNSA